MGGARWSLQRRLTLAVVGGWVGGEGQLSGRGLREERQGGAVEIGGRVVVTCNACVCQRGLGFRPLLGVRGMVRGMVKITQVGGGFRVLGFSGGGWL